MAVGAIAHFRTDRLRGVHGERLARLDLAPLPIGSIHWVQFYPCQDQLLRVEQQEADVEVIHSQGQYLLHALCQPTQLQQRLGVDVAPGSDGSVLAEEQSWPAASAALPTSLLGSGVHGGHSRNAGDNVRGRLPDAHNRLDHGPCEASAATLGEAADTVLFRTFHGLSEDVQSTPHTGGKGLARLLEAVDRAVDLFHLLMEFLLSAILLVHGQVLEHPSPFVDRGAHAVRDHRNCRSAQSQWHRPTVEERAAAEQGKHDLHQGGGIVKADADGVVVNRAAVGRKLLLRKSDASSIQCEKAAHGNHPEHPADGGWQEVKAGERQATPHGEVDLGQLELLDRDDGGHRRRHIALVGDRPSGACPNLIPAEADVNCVLRHGPLQPTQERLQPITVHSHIQLVHQDFRVWHHKVL
mmetsp:Transcript_26500/g.61601  ORF Transcript_26500/g.61601 Transcript_26500/m.61601 type:complete len:411 (-) Transcript_26500:5461-6693(-)